MIAPLDERPTDAEVTAFLSRYEAALPEAGDDAFEDHVGAAAVVFGISLGRLQASALRRALPPGSHVMLPIVTRYQVPAFVEALLATVEDPTQRLFEARQRLMGVTVKASEAKSKLWTAKTDADRKALYEHLNTMLTDAGEATRALDALRALDELHAGPPVAGGADSIVECPVALAPVSCRWSCARCVWHGPVEASCYAPEARRMMMSLGKHVTQLQRIPSGPEL